MWLVLTGAVARSYDWGAIAAVAAAVVTLLGVVLTVVTSLRSSARSEDNKREADLDDRVDAELARVTAENGSLRADRDRFWLERNSALEREVAYRRWIREQGGNPDEVIARG